jgi:hypothetical protein
VTILSTVFRSSPSIFVAVPRWNLSVLPFSISWLSDTDARRPMLLKNDPGGSIGFSDWSFEGQFCPPGGGRDAGVIT